MSKFLLKLFSLVCLVIAFIFSVLNEVDIAMFALIISLYCHILERDFI